MTKAKNTLPFSGLADLIAKEINTLSHGRYNSWQQIHKIWNSTVGKKLAEQTKVISQRGSILVVGVASSPWMQELSFMKPEILNRLNECELPETLTDIQLRLLK